MIACVLGYIVRIRPQLLKDSIDRVLSVKKLPHVNAGGAQAEAATGVGVEKHSPVVKLLPEHDVRVGDGIFAVRQHGLCSPFW